MYMRVQVHKAMFQLFLSDTGGFFDSQCVIGNFYVKFAPGLLLEPLSCTLSCYCSTRLCVVIIIIITTVFVGICLATCSVPVR